jgi:hypothetical protein
MKGLYPVSLACEVLEVSASGYFNWLRQRHSCCSGPSGRHSDEALLAHIRAIHAQVKGEYGWPRMHKELLTRGIRVGKDRVRRLMQRIRPANPSTPNEQLQAPSCPRKPSCTPCLKRSPIRAPVSPARAGSTARNSRLN